MARIPCFYLSFNHKYFILAQLVVSMCAIEPCIAKPHFTTTLVVTSCDSNACSVCAWQACLGSTGVHVVRCD